VKNNIDYTSEHKRNFKQIFNRFVGSNGQEYTPVALSTITGIPTITIREHMKEFGSMPALPCLILYMKVFDVSFADALLSYAGLSVLRAEEHEAPTTHQAQSALAKTMHKVAVALEDGEVDEGERKDLSPIIRETSQQLTALANEYDEVTV
jgi:hypothetical protein